MNESVRNVIIVGSGPAGLTAAIYAARANLNPMLVHGSLSGGQLMTTTEVENFPGFPDGIMGPKLMMDMQQQAERFGTEFVFGTVESIDFKMNPFTLMIDGAPHKTKSVILATGASPRKLGLAREDELLGYGLSTCATCDGAFFRDKVITVVGGGDSACEEALFLTKFGSKVYLIHRRDELRASKIMAERVQKHPKIEILWNSFLTELQGSKESGITGAQLENTLSGESRAIACSAIFYAIGHVPNSTLAKGSIELDENGYVITAPNSTATNIPGVFACGDLQDHVYRQAITAAGTGCMAAIETERYLAEHE